MALIDAEFVRPPWEEPLREGRKWYLMVLREVGIAVRKRAERKRQFHAFCLVGIGDG